MATRAQTSGLRGKLEEMESVRRRRWHTNRGFCNIGTMMFDFYCLNIEWIVMHKVKLENEKCFLHNKCHTAAYAS